MALTRDTFDYAGYLRSLDITDDEIDELDLDNEEIRDAVYTDATRNLYKEIKSQPSMSIDNAKKHTLALMDDGHQALGVKRERSREAQFADLSVAGLQRTLQEGGMAEGNFSNVLAKDSIGTHISRLQKNKWENPDLNSAEKSFLKKAMEAQLADQGIYTVQDVLDWRPVQEIDHAEVAKDVDQRGFFATMADGLRRSSRNQPLQTLGRDLLTLEAAPPTRPGVHARRINDIARKLSTAQRRHAEIDTHPELVRLVRPNASFTDVLSELWSNPSIIPYVMAEQGHDLVEEISPMIGAATAVAFAPPTAPAVVPAGILGSGAVTRNNVIRNGMIERASRYARERGLTDADGNPTVHGYRTFMQDKAAMAEAASKATTQANIIGAGAAGSAAIGAGAIGALGSVVARVANRAGMEIAEEGGKLIFKAAPKMRHLGGRIVGAGAIDVGAEYAAGEAVDESASMGNLVLEGVVGTAMSVGDVAVGVTSKMFDAGTDIREGGVYTDKATKKSYYVHEQNTDVTAQRKLDVSEFDPDTGVVSPKIQTIPRPTVHKLRDITTHARPLTEIALTPPPKPREPVADVAEEQKLLTYDPVDYGPRITAEDITNQVVITTEEAQLGAEYLGGVIEDLTESVPALRGLGLPDISYMFTTTDADTTHKDFAGMERTFDGVRDWKSSLHRIGDAYLESEADADITIVEELLGSNPMTLDTAGSYRNPNDGWSAVLANHFNAVNMKRGALPRQLVPDAERKPWSDELPPEQQSKEYLTNIQREDTTMSQMLGQFVTYRGQKGTLFEREGQFYVAGEEDTVHLYGAKASTRGNLIGVTMSDPEWGVWDAAQRTDLANTIHTDWDTNTVQYAGRNLTYVRAEENRDGVTFSIVLKDDTGAEVHISDEREVATIEAQKISAELRDKFDSSRIETATRIAMQSDIDAASLATEEGRAAHESLIRERIQEEITRHKAYSPVLEPATGQPRVTIGFDATQEVTEKTISDEHAAELAPIDEERRAAYRDVYASNVAEKKALQELKDAEAELRRLEAQQLLGPDAIESVPDVAPPDTFGQALEEAVTKKKTPRKKAKKKGPAPLAERITEDDRIYLEELGFDVTQLTEDDAFILEVLGFDERIDGAPHPSDMLTAEQKRILASRDLDAFFVDDILVDDLSATELAQLTEEGFGPFLDAMRDHEEALIQADERTITLRSPKKLKIKDVLTQAQIADLRRLGHGDIVSGEVPPQHALDEAETEELLARGYGPFLELAEMFGVSEDVDPSILPGDITPADVLAAATVYRRMAREQVKTLRAEIKPQMEAALRSGEDRVVIAAKQREALRPSMNRKLEAEAAYVLVNKLDQKGVLDNDAILAGTIGTFHNALGDISKFASKQQEATKTADAPTADTTDVTPPSTKTRQVDAETKAAKTTEDTRSAAQARIDAARQKAVEARDKIVAAKKRLADAEKRAGTINDRHAAERHSAARTSADTKRTTPADLLRGRITESAPQQRDKDVAAERDGPDTSAVPATKSTRRGSKPHTGEVTGDAQDIGTDGRGTGQGARERRELVGPPTDRSKGLSQKKRTPSPKYWYQVRMAATEQETFEAQWGTQPGQYIPLYVLQPLIDNHRYAVTVIEDKVGNISGLNVITPAHTYKVRTKSISKRAESTVDRAVTVERDGRIVDILGGNKNFRIPPDRPPIDPLSTDNQWHQQINDAVREADGRFTQDDSPDVREAEINRTKITIWRTTDDDGVTTAHVQREGDAKSTGFITPFAIVTRNRRERARLHLAARKAKKRAKDSASKKAAQADEIPSVNQQFKRVLEADKRRARSIKRDDVTADGETEIRYSGVLQAAVQEELVMDEMTVPEGAFDNDQDTIFGEAGYTEATPEFTRQLIALLPQHIQDIIEVQYANSKDPDKNFAESRNAIGTFSPNYNGTGPRIFLNMSRPRTKHQFASTLSHEVAHFGFSSWGSARVKNGRLHSIGRLDPLYKRAYALFKPHIVRSLGGYIDMYGVDPDNPPNMYRYSLVNELFSQLGTTFADFIDDRVAMPFAGMDAAEISSLRNDARKTQDAIVLDMEKIGALDQNSDAAEIKAFAQQLIKLQTRSVMGESARFDFQFHSGLDRMVLEIHTTPNGQVRYSYGSREEGVRLRKKRLKYYARSSQFKQKMDRLIRANSIFGDGFLGPDISRTITSNSALAAHKSVLRLEAYVKQRDSVNALLRSRGVRDINEGVFPPNVRTAQEKFAVLGLDSFLQKELAEEYDRIATDLQAEKHAINNDIRKHLMRGRDVLEHHAKRQGMTEKEIFALARPIDDFYDEIRADWDHVRYKAFDDEDDAQVLRDMLEHLKDNPDRPDRAKFDERKRKLDAQNAEHHATPSQELSDAERTAMFGRGPEAQAEMDKYDTKVRIERGTELAHVNHVLDRLQHLRRAMIYRVAETQDHTMDIPQMQIQYLQKVLDARDDSPLSKFGVGAISRQSDSLRDYKYDHSAGEFTSDYHKIRFLDPITDPTEVAIYNIERQAEIQRLVAGNVELATRSLEYDMASLQKTAEHTTQASVPQPGTVLDALYFDPLILTAMKEEIDAQRSIDGGVFNNLIGALKRNLTKYSFWGMSSNVVSMLSMASLHGDILRISRYPRWGQSTRMAWRAKWHTNEKVIVAGGQATPETQPTLTQAEALQLVKEAQEHNLLGLGIGSLQLEVAGRTTFDGAGVARALTRLSKMTDQFHRTANMTGGAIKSMDSLLSEMYTFPDEIPKLIRYAINRDLMHAKWAHKLDPANYNTPTEYDNAVTHEAVREAASLTSRESVDYSAMPLAIKQLITSQLRMWVANFLTHNVQMVKVAAEHFRIMKEQTAEFAKLGADTSPSAKAYRSELAKSMAGKIAGTGIVGGSLSAIGAGGLSISLMALNFILDMLGEDEERFTEREQEGAKRILEFLSSTDIGMHFAPIGQKISDTEFVAIDAQRAHQFGVLTAPPEKGKGIIDRVPDAAASLILNTSARDNLAPRIINMLRGITEQGEKLEGEAFWKNVEQELKLLTVPRFAIETQELAQSRSAISGKRKHGIETTTKILGLRTRVIDIETEAAKVGYQIHAERSKNRGLNALIKEYSLGRQRVPDVVVLAQAKNVLNKHAESAATWRYFVEGLRMFGMPDGRIINALTSSVNNKNMAGSLDKTFAGALVHGRNPFIITDLNRVNKKIEHLISKPIHKTLFTKQDKDTALINMRALAQQLRIAARSMR